VLLGKWLAENPFLMLMNTASLRAAANLSRWTSARPKNVVFVLGSHNAAQLCGRVSCPPGLPLI